MYGLNGSSVNNPFLRGQTENSATPRMFASGLRPSEVIRQCKEGATLYRIFGLDQKFHLINDGGPKDEYSLLSGSIKGFAAVGNIRPAPMPKFYNENLTRLIDELTKLELPTMNSNLSNRVRYFF